MKGVKIKASPTASEKLFDKDIKPILIAPRKVLPISPINIFAGLQFHIINAIRELNSKMYGCPICKKIQHERIEINNDPPTIPSIPSIKFIKFIKAVNTKVIRIKSKKLK